VAVECGPLRRSELRDAAALLARAFADDGIISHYFAAPRRQRYAVPALFRSVLYRHVPLGTVFAARDAGQVVGVAIWAPPGAPQVSSRARARSWLAVLGTRLLFPRGSRRLLAGLDELSRFHPTEPHWYLVFTGVEPGRQHGGVGTALLTPVIERAQREGLACYLETPFPETHAFYGRLGFQLVATVDVFPGTRPMSTMATSRSAGSSER
jgi:GNAT superfamily N-acetyltransferase